MAKYELWRYGTCDHHRKTVPITAPKGPSASTLATAVCAPMMRGAIESTRSSPLPFPQHACTTQSIFQDCTSTGNRETPAPGLRPRSLPELERHDKQSHPELSASQGLLSRHRTSLSRLSGAVTEEPTNPLNGAGSISKRTPREKSEGDSTKESPDTENLPTNTRLPRGNHTCTPFSSLVMKMTPTVFGPASRYPEWWLFPSAEAARWSRFSLCCSWMVLCRGDLDTNGAATALIHCNANMQARRHERPLGNVE